MCSMCGFGSGVGICPRSKHSKMKLNRTVVVIARSPPRLVLGGLVQNGVESRKAANAQKCAVSEESTAFIPQPPFQRMNAAPGRFSRNLCKRKLSTCTSMLASVCNDNKQQSVHCSPVSIVSETLVKRESVGCHVAIAAGLMLTRCSPALREHLFI